MSAITRIADIVMGGFARAIQSASPGSPLARAKHVLGDRFADVACEAMRRRLRVALIDRRDENARDLSSPYGELAARTIVVSVISDSIRDVIVAAGVADAA